jgi:hypothetical protein
MRLSIFHEFCQPSLLDAVRELCPEVYIDHAKQPYSKNSKELEKIYRTNAKLFYTSYSMKDIDNVLEKLQRIGFSIVDRNPFTIYKQARIVKVPDPDAEIEYKKCECGNDIALPIKTIEVSYVYDVKHYSNDRVILEVKDI